MSRPLPFALVAALFVTMLALTACSNAPVQTADGFYPTFPLDSPLSTPNPDAAVYEIAVIPDAPRDEYPRVVRLEFDPEVWGYFQDHVFNHILTNADVRWCFLVRPTADLAEPDPPVLRVLKLGDREWTVHNDSWGREDGDWRLRYRSAPYEFTLLMLNYAQQPVTDAAGRACLAAAENALSTFAIAPDASQPAAGEESEKPRVWLKANEDVAGEPMVADADGLLADSANWVRYASDRAGFSVAVPPGWSVTDADLPTVFLAPPSGDEGQRIWITWMATEKPYNKTLREWLEATAGDEMMPRFHTLVDESLPIVDPSGTSEQVRLEYGPIFSGGAYDMTHGNLLLHIETSSAWVDALPILRAVASSIEFAEDAPMTLADIPWR